MPVQLGYRKSRAGCLRCKQRRVKCDENKPCAACTRHNLPCSLTENSEESQKSQSLGSRVNRAKSRQRSEAAGKRKSPSPIDPFPYFDNRHGTSKADEEYGELWITDLELMHHYTTATCETLPRVEKLRRIWQIEVPKSGIEHPFVMHQILATAALHLGYLHPESRQRYILHASRHQSLAVAGIRKLITNITPQNCEALFSASSLLIISAYATFPDPREWGDRTTRPSTSDIVDTFCLVRGMNQVLAHSEEILHAGTFAPLFEPQPGATSTPLLNDACDRLRCLRLMLEPFANHHILGAEIDRFIHWIRICAESTNEAEMRVTMVWPIYLSAEYMSMLRQNEPQALILLSYYCAVAKGTETNTWYMRRWSTAAFEAVTDVLGSEWDAWLEWPRSVILS
ncbi:hypothetical protein CC79DRAFT_1334035 [Sarocladium strictum]